MSGRGARRNMGKRALLMIKLLKSDTIINGIHSAHIYFLFY